MFTLDSNRHICGTVAVTEENILLSGGHSLGVSGWDDKTHCWNAHGASARVLHVPFGPVVPKQGVAFSSQN